MMKEQVTMDQCIEEYIECERTGRKELVMEK